MSSSSVRVNRQQRWPFAEAPRAVYLHIPFCTKKCHYCDFNTYALSGQPVSAYLDALEREMEQTVLTVPPVEIDSIFVGGGTPTVLTASEMERFMQMTAAYFPQRSAQFEFTMEANPGTVEEDKLAVMKAGGVNRLSMGVQAFQLDLLQRLGRIHDVEEVYESIATAQRVGFDNLSIDLMFGLPDQTIAMMEQSLDAALSLDLQHYSIYGLKIEENTWFHKLRQRNELPLPEEDEEYDMYMLIMNRLQQAGYAQYEISNFAKPGRESKHNIVYWRNQSYYGLGAGAHGYVQGRRQSNVRGVQAYIDAVKDRLPYEEVIAVSREEAMEDFMMVGLRLLDGVRNADFQAQFDTTIDQMFGDVVQALIAQGLLQTHEEGYRMSARGVLLGNEVFSRFIGSIT